MLKYLWRFTMWVVLLAAAISPLQTLAEDANSDLFASIGANAKAYAARLEQDQSANYSASERTWLRVSANLLIQHNHCVTALNLARQVVSGLSDVPFTDWLLVGRAARCADKDEEALAAAWLGTQWDDETSNAELRKASLLLLAEVLYANPSYGLDYSLAIYQKAMAYGAPVADTIHAIEQKKAERQKQLEQEQAERQRQLEQQQAEARKLRVERFFIQNDTTQPAICFEFSVDMPGASQRNYGDFIRFEPTFKPTFRIADSDEVCVDGAAFGTTYKATILPGLTSNAGNSITATLEYEVEVENRATTVWFANSSYVLPVGGGVPIHAVNAAKVELTLYRVVDRNLLDKDVRDMLRTNISSWQTQQIRDELGEQVWTGEADLTEIPNQETVTNLPLAAKAPQTPGVYVLTAIPTPAEGDEEDYTKATLWLVISDIGITSYQGAAGLTLITRSLATGKPLGGVHLALYARNNVLLGDTTSDADGVARLPRQMLEGTAGREPITIMASGPKTDFNFLDLSLAPYDLSDRGVAGRQTPGPVDAFLYTERGVYRPGEAVQLTTLLRSDLGQAIDGNLPLTIRLLRPDDKLAIERVVNSPTAGGYTTSFALSRGVRTGTWTAQAFLDPKAKPIGSVTFEVQDIVPPRIEVNVTKTPPIPLQLGAAVEFGIQARYLFGAVGADLAATGELRIVADPNPFPNFAGYRFGPVDEANDSTLEPLTATRTDSEGNAKFMVEVVKLPNLKQPLQAKLSAEVADVDGRTVATSYDLPLRQQSLYLGIKAPGDGGQVAEGTAARFEVIALNAAGQPVALPNLTFNLVEEQTDYQWYKEDDRWHYKGVVRDNPLSKGALTIAATTPATVDIPLTSGKYRLEVTDATSGAVASARVESGWAASSQDADTPDKLIVRSDREDYRPGEIAKLTIQTPFIGPASLVLAADDRILSVTNLELTGREQTVPISVDAKWGPGVYALITAYRPDQGTEGHGPRRAVGLAWLGLAPDLHQLPISIVVPERILPRQRFYVKVQATQSTPEQSAYVTLAAVDEGVLRLTDYQNPDPLAYYFGQRTLGVELRDIYGRLIDGHQGAPGKIRSGGDGSSQRGAPDSHIEVVSLFSGVVKLDAAGQALIPMDIPDFNGRLRLIAVAWDHDRVGSAEAPLTVRDPVVVMPSVPRFLAMGDQSRANVLINNMDGAAGDYRLSWTTTGVLALGSDISEKIMPIPVGSKATVDIQLLANGMGNGTLTLHLTDPNGKTLDKETKIGVRAPFLPERQTSFGKLDPQVKAVIGTGLVVGLRPETVTGILSVSTTPALDVPGLLRQLDLYPYGCLEQVTSRAFPLLHIKSLGTRWNYTSKVPVSQRLTDAVSRLLEKQRYDGGFGLWSSDSAEEPWLSVHAMDFLQQAKAAGIEVPDFMWNQGLLWLRSKVSTANVKDKEIMAVQAYALYILARNGERPIETARYLLDQGKDELPSKLAAAQLGAALHIMGEAAHATTAFALTDTIERESNLHDYGSVLRDLAGLVLLTTEAAQSGQAELVQSLAEAMRDNTWLSTQEQAWIVRAANVVTDPPAPLQVKIGDKVMPARTTPLVTKIAADALVPGFNLTNLGKTAAWYSLAVDGSPISPPLPMTEGLEIKRSILDLAGNAIDLGNVAQGTLVVVVLDGKTTTTDIDHQLLVIDPLPAGLEIENASLAHATTTDGLTWLGDLTAVNYSESLDDRFVAALDLNDDNKRSFRLAYLARAVAPGRYRIPPVLMEDMYKPNYRARGGSDWLRIIPAK